MKNIRGAILALCVVALGGMAALAQSANTATGYDALHSDTTGYYNTADGYETLYANTNGGYNTAIGSQALLSNISGGYDTAIGASALAYNTSGFYNTATGYEALYHNTGTQNTATGAYALVGDTSGYGNTAYGYSALDNNTTGTGNIAIGAAAGNAVTSGSGNIHIGNQGSPGDSETIRIGDVQTSFYAAGIDGVTVSSGVEVFINPSGQLGTVNSSRRFKEDVRDMGDASSAILRLRPVTYRYKQAYADGSKPVDYGLIAEEVAEVYPDLVVRGTDGQIQTVQYQKLTPMLLNELQKQHQLLEQMGKTMAQQQQTIQLLKAQQTETVQLLEKRLAALEAAQSSSGLVARAATQ